MMITMHSLLEEKYSRLSAVFDNSLLFISIILNALVFVDNSFISKYTNLNADNLKFITGVASILLLAISVVIFQVNWKEQVEDHRKAGEQLFLLLQTCRALLSMSDGAEKDNSIAEFNKTYSQILNLICKVPDDKFNQLKLKHYRKIELSKLIDKNPGSLLIILKIRLFISSFREKREE